MARVAVIAAALARVVWRDFQSLGSIAGNNLFFFLLFLLLQPQSGLFLAVLLALPVLFLLSGDALGKVPRDRLALWPLTKSESAVLRGVSLGLNPLVWIAAAIGLLEKQGAWALLLLGVWAIGQVVAGGLRGRSAQVPGRSFWHLLPTGSRRLGALVSKNLRQLLSTLDPYPLIPLSIGTLVYRLAAPKPNPSAFPVISVVIAMGLSTLAQNLFGFDGPGGRDRYRLMPLVGWTILLAQGLAFLAVLLVLVLPLRPDVGIAGGLVALAIGHHSSVLQPEAQRRGRFTSGRIWPNGLIQIVATVAIGMAVAQSEVWILLAIGSYAASLLLYGKIWDTRMTKREV